MADQDQPRRLLQVYDVAAILDISRNKAHELVASGVIPAFRVGRQWRIRPEVMDKWMADAEMTSTKALRTPLPW